MDEPLTGQTDACNAVACTAGLPYYRCPERARCAAALHLRERVWRAPTFTAPPWPKDETDDD